MRQRLFVGNLINSQVLLTQIVDIFIYSYIWKTALDKNFKRLYNLSMYFADRSEPEVPRLQRPDLGIEVVQPSETVTVSKESFPWMSEKAIEIPTVMIKPEHGTEFRYGSIVRCSKKLIRLANVVPPEFSINAEQGLFKGIPSWLDGNDCPNIDRVPKVLSTEPLYKVAKRGNDAARLVFTVMRDGTEPPIVLKVAISRHKDQVKMMSILTRQSKKSKGD